MGKLILAFTVIPFLETYLLYLLGTSLGFFPTLAVVLGTGAVGAWLAKREGMRVVKQWQDAMAQGELPEDGVTSGLLVLVGGVLLVTPGVLTDITGLLLLVPQSRRWIAQRVTAQVKKKFQAKVADGSVRVVSISDLGGFAGVGPAARVAERRGAVIEVQGIEVEGVEVTDEADAAPILLGPPST